MPSKEESSIYREWGVSYLLLADYAAAIADLDRAITLTPEDLWARFNRGCAHHRAQRFRSALQDFSWVIDQDHQNAQAHFNKGVIYAQLGRKEEAISNLQQAARCFQVKGGAIAAHRAQHLIDKLQHNQRGQTTLAFLFDVSSNIPGKNA
ncbi:MAG: tetratricopeptide repeat protein [Phormidesmis sp.]